MRRMQPMAILAGALFVTSGAIAQTDSGPKPGTKVEALKAFDVTGDHAGESVDFVAERKGQPTAYLFVNAEHWDRPMARFIKVLDQELKKGVTGAPEASIIAIWLTDDVDKAKNYLPIAQNSLQLEKSTLAVFEGTRFGPMGWAISGDAYLTTIVVRDGKVVASYGYISVNDTNVPEVVKSLQKKQ